MLSDSVYEIFRQGFRVLILGIIPLGVVVIGGSLLSSLLQGAMNIRDESVSYGVRLLLLVLAVSFMFESFGQELLSLFEIVFH